MTGRGKPRSARSASAPALQVTCGSYSRERSRETDIGYERGKDRVTHWIGAWNFNQVCSVLQSLVTRCPLNQLEYLWTALESVPHRDFQQSAEGRHRGLLFLPLSTPLSRELRTRLNRSRKTENKRLYRVQSAHIHDELVHTYPPPLPQSQSEAQLPRSPFPPESTPQWRLPGLRPSPSPSYPLTRPHSTLPPTSRPISIRWQSSTRQSGRMLVRSLSTPPSRILSPMRRHMTASSPREIISALETDTRTPPPLLPQRVFLPSSPSTPLPHGGESPLSPEALQFLSWFTDLEKDWQQQEVLQLVVWNLDQRELYFLTALLMSRRYRDFLAHLPESLAVQVLSHIPPKDILRHCCRVSHVWSVRCSSETLWREKCQQGQLGLPMVNVLSWKRLFVDDLRLKRNWRKGRCTTRPLLGHSKRVLCVRMRDGLVATGSADRSIRVWSLDNGECLHTLQGHLRSVWCLCFYGKNLLISGSSDSSIRIWNFRTGVCERTLEGHSGPVWSVQLKKEVLISGSHDKTAAIWDIRHCCFALRLEGHRGAVFSVDLDDTTTLAYTGSGDKTIMQWDVATGHCLKVVRASKTQPVMALHWHSGYLASSTGDVIILWSAHTGRKIAEFRGHEDRVESVQLRVNSGKSGTGLLLSAGRDRTIKYWDISSGRCIHTLSGHEDGINCAYCDNVHIVSVSNDRQALVWDFHPQSALSIAQC